MFPTPFLHLLNFRTQKKHKYDESLLLLKGELELRMDNSTYVIHEGDSFYIPKNCLHNYMNTSDKEATIIVYFSQLVY